MKGIIFSLGIITVAAMFIFAGIPVAEGQAGSEEMVQCAFDGMKMSKSAMKSQMDYQDKTYYFCTEEEKEKFAQTPEKYLKMHGGMQEGQHEGMEEGEHEGIHEGKEEHGEHQEGHREEPHQHEGMMEGMGMGMGSGSGHGGMHGGSGSRHGH
jgi:YHS domain-containing protein